MKQRCKAPPPRRSAPRPTTPLHAPTLQGTTWLLFSFSRPQHAQCDAARPRQSLQAPRSRCKLTPTDMTLTGALPSARPRPHVATTTRRRTLVATSPHSSAHDQVHAEPVTPVQGTNCAVAPVYRFYRRMVAPARGRAITRYRPLVPLLAPLHARNPLRAANLPINRSPYPLRAPACFQSKI